MSGEGTALPSLPSSSTFASDGPVRSCCGRRHTSPVCPDGLVRCCLCFGRFTIEELHEVGDGQREDVCVPCAEADEAALIESLHDEDRQ